MNQYISIAMTQQAVRMFQANATQPKFATFYQLVNVESKTNSNLHTL